MRLLFPQFGSGFLPRNKPASQHVPNCYKAPRISPGWVAEPAGNAALALCPMAAAASHGPLVAMEALPPYTVFLKELPKRSF